MLAVKARVENGNIKWLGDIPSFNADVIVVFATVAKPGHDKRKKMSNKEAMRILNKYAGTIERDIDYEKEKDEYFNEKYGPFN